MLNVYEKKNGVNLKTLWSIILIILLFLPRIFLANSLESNAGVLKLVLKWRPQLSVVKFPILSFSNNEDEKTMDDTWIDPVIEIENEEHSHNDLLAHRLSTPNVKLIDYHNLNCDGNISPPPELDNVAGM